MKINFKNYLFPIVCILLFLNSNIFSQEKGEQAIIEIKSIEKTREILNGYWELYGIANMENYPIPEEAKQEVLWLNFNSKDNKSGFYKIPLNEIDPNNQKVDTESIFPIITIVKNENEIKLELTDLYSGMKEIMNIKFIDNNKIQLMDMIFKKMTLKK